MSVLRLTALLSIGLCLGLATGAAAAPKPDAAGLPGVFYDDAYVTGGAKAKVTVEEYGSAVCSHCAQFDASVMPALKSRYIDKGKIRYVFHEFLTEPAQVAASAFIVARCAGKGQYFAVVEDVFKAQPEMFSGRPGSEPTVVLKRIAMAHGVDEARFSACLSDPQAVRTLQARLDHAYADAHIDSTPTILINGQRLDPHVPEWTIDVLAPAIDAALKSAH